ncbi:AMP-binding protein, partial [Mycolicibacterium hassiacum]
WPVGGERVAPGVGVSITGRFAEVVGGCAGAVAVVDGGRSWTYGELDAASNRLAHRLIGAGVGPGDAVVVLLERSAEAVAAILGVLKAGAVYVPIDPVVPDARIGFIVHDATPKVVVSARELTGRIAGFGVPVIDVTDPGLARCPATAPTVSVAPDDLAHIIYTSGTTGQPKGVAVTHANVTRLFDGLDAMWTSPDNVWTQCASLAFDYSVWEMWGALLHGGRLVVVPDAVTHSPDELQDLLAAEGVTVLSQTPTAVAMLSPEQVDTPTLVVAAEACPTDVVNRWAPGRTMVNGYGPTETTVYATLSDPLVAGVSVVPVGRAVPGAVLFVLDGWLRPVPVGVVGELYVGGRG